MALAISAARVGLGSVAAISRITVSTGTVASTDSANSFGVVRRPSCSITGAKTRGDVATSAYDDICFSAKLDPCARSVTESPATAMNNRVVAVYFLGMANVTAEASARAVRAMMSTPSHRRRRISRYSPSSTARSPESTIASELTAPSMASRPTYVAMLAAADLITEHTGESWLPVGELSQAWARERTAQQPVTPATALGGIDFNLARAHAEVAGCLAFKLRLLPS